MKSFLVAFTFLCHVSLSAQTPDAALIRLTEKHDADIKALSEKRDAMTKSARDAYIVALNDAEATARNSERITEVTAIEAERAAFEKHTFAATNPGLPTRLVALRTKYLAAQAQADRQFKPLIDANNNGYLASLNELESNARKSSNDALVKQVGAAKAKFLGVPPEKPKDGKKVSPEKEKTVPNKKPL